MVAETDSRVVTAATRVWADLWGDGRGWILVFVSIGWFLALGVRIVYPALLPQVAAEFAIDYATIGVLISVLWMSYALLQFPGGVVADFIGERAVLVISVGITILGVVGILFAFSLPWFVVTTIVIGIGTGFYGTTRITVLSAVYSDRDATAISISQAAGNVGNVVLPITAGVVSVYLGWRWGFGVLLPLFILTAIGFWVFVPRRAAAPQEDTASLAGTMRQVGGAISDSRVLAVTSILFLTMFMYQSVTGFLPTYLAEVKALPPSTAASVYGLFFASAIGVQFVSGLVADRYDRRFAIAGFLGLSVPAFGLLAFADDLIGVIGVVLLMSCMLGGFPPAHAYAVRALPPAVQGSGYGLLRTLYIAFGALGPPAIGILADIGRFDEAFFALGAVALLTSITALLLPRV